MPSENYRKLQGSSDPKLGDDERIVWHYTSWDALQGMVQKKKLWATHVMYLNDKREMRHGIDLFKKMLEDTKHGGAKQVLERMDVLHGNSAFAFSTTESFDDLSQWRGYARAQTPVAIGFGVAALRRLGAAYGFSFEPCVYGDSKEPLNNLFAELESEHDSMAKAESSIDEADSSAPDARRSIRRSYNRLVTTGVPILMRSISPLMKDSAFKDEAEFRLVLTGGFPVNPKLEVDFRIRGDLVIPFVKVPTGVPGGKMIEDGLFRGILIGPSVSADLIVASTSNYLRLNDVDALVAESTIPYRW